MQRMDVEWEGIKISIRTSNCFKNAGITSLEQLTSMTQADLLRLENFGRKSLNQVEEALHQKGLKISRSLLDPRSTAEGQLLYSKYIDAKLNWELYRETFYVNDLSQRLKELKK